uniref:Uncharacterized protein n=1 Tax=Craspedostauros australis TaxID=1486917 RepID=A0A7R9ZP05_9STRA|mmetsp:Transcript_506/g.1431  ORF Transcript_506/g.1431 Transcript_506/m.1431 type:complete len:100 (+) Transcript_506:187-486(+)|eukprot:CAMPEP_0198124502 /NCGR_PEP_ID=MMETSP1442-20131203/40031_1 /TAXON_ID= /ORGANISM="Craspedostauros australis, Strain CCMP3328" /LENGTH=99 /DNA_ID=CAMNT_0043783903 /DNA_START=152 /DNA_END=451 /DNA_ORIENTATION=-
MSNNNNSNGNSGSNTSHIQGPTPGQNDRTTSVDSAAFFEAQDEYDDYDDFGLSGGGGGGGGNAKIKRRQDNRGGSGGSGTIYSAKHVRAKEAQRKTGGK